MKKEHLHGLLKIKTCNDQCCDGGYQASLSGEEKEIACHVDVILIINAWGLEIGECTMEVKRVLLVLFDEDSLLGLDSILVRASGVKIVECSNEEVTRLYGFILFLICWG